MKDIVLFGIQWSWKWTQAQRILQEYPDNFLYFEPWNILRALKSNDNVLWNYVKWIIERWEYVRSRVINSLFQTALSILHEWHYILIDWYPRKLKQFYFLIQKMDEINRDFVVIQLDMPENVAIERLSSRRVCKSCWTVYNININWDLKECMKCKWEVIIRHDDYPDAIRQRLHLYFNETDPILDEFNKLKVLRKIDATRSVDEIYDDIDKIISEKSSNNYLMD